MRERWLWLVKNTLNRVTSRAARSGRGPFSLVRHVGRRSGRTYETPIIAAPAADGFVVELTYGDTVNWYRNIVHAGGCELVVKGRTHRVVAIEPYPEEQGRTAFPAPARVALRLMRRHEYRLLRTDEAVAA